MNDNMNRWKELKEKCKTAANSFREMVAKSNEAGMKAQMELDGKVGEFCSKYSALRNSNPAAGCEGDFSPSSLYGDATKIAAHIDTSVPANLDEYRNFCAQFNNESENGTETEDSDNATPHALKKICSSGSWQSALNNLTTRVLRELPPQHRRKSGDIRRFVQGGSPSLSSIGVGGSFGQALKKIRSLQSKKVTARDTGGSSAMDHTAASDKLNSAYEDFTGALTSAREIRLDSSTATFSGSTNTAIEGCFRSATITIANTNPQTIETAIVGLVEPLQNNAQEAKDASGSTQREKTLALKTSTQSASRSLDSVSACIGNLSATGAQGEALELMKRQINGAKTSVARGLPDVVAAVDELGGPESSRSTASNSDNEGESTNDVCEALTILEDRRVDSNCPTGTAGTATRCRERYEERNTRNAPTSALRGISSEVGEVLQLAAAGSAGGQEKLWSSIGQRASGTCERRAFGNRGGGGVFEQMLDQFDPNPNATGTRIR